MQLLAGLGNPGSQYESTRHNIGFMAVDRIAHRHNFSPWKEKFHGQVCEGRLGTQKVFLFKPMTFMNRSGVPLAEICNFYKIPPEQVVVIYDELDLPLGKLRVKQGGGNNGHNGLKSIDAHFGLNYHRVRLGIEHPGTKEAVTGHVLGKFAPNEQGLLEAMLDAVTDAAPLLAKDDGAGFMNKVALAMQPQLGEKKA
ncbi:MAG: aminoacyl-tRNA hydrolase [Alphaproteobacteria bacterium]|nr:aminoacyl-tRNA hydrolase [Alphaproteobacteria bacterium]